MMILELEPARWRTASNRCESAAGEVHNSFKLRKAAIDGDNDAVKRLLDAGTPVDAAGRVRLSQAFALSEALRLAASLLAHFTRPHRRTAGHYFALEASHFAMAHA
jgi:hypothetical protein